MGIVLTVTGSNSRALSMRQWGKLIDDQLAVVAGERDYLDGKFQARHGVSRGAQKRLAEWRTQHRKIVLYFHAYFAAQGAR